MRKNYVDELTTQRLYDVKDSLGNPIAGFEDVIIERSDVPIREGDKFTSAGANVTSDLNEYILPDAVVGSEIQMTLYSAIKRVLVNLQSPITSGPVTVNRNGEGALPLKLVSGVSVTNLPIGYYEIIDTGTEFVLQNDSYVRETLAHTQSDLVKSLPVGTLDGAVDNLSWHGLTLVNSVFANIEFTETVANDDLLYLMQSGSFKLVSNGTLQRFSEMQGNEYFYYAKFKPTSTTTVDRGQIFTGSNISNSLGDGLEFSFTRVAPNADTDQAYLAVRVNGAGDLVTNYAIVIDKTELGLESLTESQMLDLARSGYIDGIQSMYRPKLEIRNLGETNNSQITADVYLRGFSGVFDEIYESNNQIYENKKIEEETFLTGVAINTTNFPEAKSSGVFTLIQDDGVTESGIVDGSYTTTDAGTIQYELATPETINLTEQGLADGELIAFEDGTVYNTSDTFGSIDISFDVPANPSAQMKFLLDSALYQANQIEFNEDRITENELDIIDLQKPFYSRVSAVADSISITGAQIDAGYTANIAFDKLVQGVSAFSGGGIQVPEDGIYSISAQAFLSGTANGTGFFDVVFTIEVDGVRVARTSRELAPTDVFTGRYQVNTIFELSANSVVTLEIFIINPDNTNGATIDTSEDYETYLAVKKG